MAKFYGGQYHLSVLLAPTLAQMHTGGHISAGANSGLTNATNAVIHIGSDTSDDMDAVTHFSSDTSDDMDPFHSFHSDSCEDLDTTRCIHSDARDIDTGNSTDLGNSNDTITEYHKGLDISKDVCAGDLVDSNNSNHTRTSDVSLELNIDSRKSSTAFTVDFGSDSSSGLSISDKLSRYLPKHVAQSVERRASNVKVRSDRGKSVDKKGLLSRSVKSLPGVQVRRRQTRDEATGKPDKRKSLPIVSIRRIDTPHRQQTQKAPKKQTNEGKRNSVSSTLRNNTSCNNTSCNSTSTFRKPCRRFSCPLNQHSSRSAPLVNDSHLTSPRNSHLTSPRNSHITSPHNSHLTSPRNSHITSPHNSHITSPHNSHLTSPRNSHLTSPRNSHLTSPRNSHLTSPRSTDANPSILVDCLDSKAGEKLDELGVLRSTESYTILNTTKGEEVLDSISDSGTYEVDEEHEDRDDILKARRTISHVFGVGSSPKRGALTPKRLVQFTRSSARKQSPAKKTTTVRSAIVQPVVKISSLSADTIKSKFRCPAKGRSGQFGEPKGSNLVESRNSSSYNQLKKISKVATQRATSGGVLSGRETRPNNHRSSPINQPLKSSLRGYGVTSSDLVVHQSSSGKVVVSCPAIQRPSPAAVTLRTNRTFQLRCARLEASTADGRNADKSSILLRRMQPRVPKSCAGGTSSRTSICSRDSAGSSLSACRDIVCGGLRGCLKESVRRNSCSLLQEEVLSPVDSLVSVTVDGSHTSLDTAVQQQTKKPYVRKTSSLLAYHLPRGGGSGEKYGASTVQPSSKGLTFRDRFALELPEVRAWHERHQKDLLKATSAKVLPGNRKPVQMMKKERDKTNLLGNNSTVSVAGTCRSSFSFSQITNGNKLNALKMLLRMSQEITAELRGMNESHARGVTVPPTQQQTVTNAMLSAFKNFLHMQKDIQELGKLFKIYQQ